MCALIAPSSQRLRLFHEICNRDQLVALLLELRQQHLQHRRRPLAAVVADDDGARMRHAENMPRIYLWVRHLGIVRVDASERDAEASVSQQASHAIVEEARAWAEVVVRQRLVLCRVRVDKLLLDLVDLLLELLVAELMRGLVVHGVVAQLVSGCHQLAQHLRSVIAVAIDLAADDEEGRFRPVLFQDCRDLTRVRRRSVVKRQRHGLARHRRQLKQHVRVLVAHVAHQVPRRLVQAV